jgi:hypothetical protein
MGSWAGICCSIPRLEYAMIAITVTFRKDSKEWTTQTIGNHRKVTIESGMKSHKGNYVASSVAGVKGNKVITSNSNNRM